jgi:arginine transport system substrate-binding protein
VDILQAICKEMNRNCVFINQPWDSLIPGLKLGKFDVIFGSMGITEERKKSIDFTDPYYYNTGTFIAAKNAHFSLDLNSLKGKTVGVQSGTTFENYLTATYGKNIQINRYGSIQDALLDLQSGRVDLVLGDTPLLLVWLKNSNNSNFEMVGKPLDDPKYFGDGDGFAVNKGNSALLQTLNQGLKAIKENGVYHMIEQKYFGSYSNSAEL